jgi:hypothetical protein
MVIAVRTQSDPDPDGGGLAAASLGLGQPQLVLYSTSFVPLLPVMPVSAGGTQEALIDPLLPVVKLKVQPEK